MSAAPPQPAPTPLGDPGPDWIRDAWQKIVEELRLYVRTVWGITVQPARFAAAWSNGEVRGLNPLAVMATSLAILGPIQHQFITRGKFYMHASDTVVEIYEVVVPYVMALLTGVFAHLILLLLGGRRALRISLGIAAMVSGGPNALGQLVLGGVGLVLIVKTGFSMPTLQAAIADPAHDPFQHYAAVFGAAMALIGVVSVWQLVWLARALAAAQGVRLWRGLLAVSIGIVVAVLALTPVATILTGPAGWRPVHRP
jgi:hypothetical protein